MGFLWHILRLFLIITIIIIICIIIIIIVIIIIIILTEPAKFPAFDWLREKFPTVQNCPKKNKSLYFNLQLLNS